LLPVIFTQAVARRTNLRLEDLHLRTMMPSVILPAVLFAGDIAIAETFSAVRKTLARQG
jgi:hypothetical protein